MNRGEFLKLGGLAAACAFIEVCGGGPFIRSLSTSTPSPSERTGFPTETPGIPEANLLGRVDLDKFLNSLSKEERASVNENIMTGFNFDSESLIFYQGTDKINKGRIKINGEYKPIYGTIETSSSVIWAYAQGGLTPVAPGLAKQDSDNIFRIEFLNLNNEFAIATYTAPRGSESAGRQVVNRISLLPAIKGIQIAALKADINLFESPTPESPSLPAEIGQEYIAEIEKYDYRIEGDKVFVDWYKTGNPETFELALWKTEDGKWKKRFLLHAEGAENITAEDLRYSLSNTLHVGIVPSRPERGFIDFKLNGNLWEIDNPNGKNGKAIVAEALTIRNGIEERINVVVVLDYTGTGFNIAGESPSEMHDIFFYREIFKQGDQFSYHFYIKEVPSLNGNPRYEYLKPEIPLNKKFVDGNELPDPIFCMGSSRN